MTKTSLAAIPGLFAIALAAAGVRAAPLAETTAVQARPEPAAPVITYLKAGAEPTPAASLPGPLPAGWTAVEIPGPFDAYVLNRDLTKGLDVKPGASLYLAPAEGAGVLAIAAQGDKTEITGLHGKWTRVRLNRDLVGYIQSGSVVPAESVAPLAAIPPPPEAATPGPGRPAPGYGAETGGESRLLEGRFVSTHNLLPVHRPYDWQLVDENGDRRAYLDVSKLLQTAQIDQYVNREVEVSGPMTALPGGGDVVIAVESLRLK